MRLARSGMQKFGCNILAVGAALRHHQRLTRSWCHERELEDVSHRWIHQLRLPRPNGPDNPRSVYSSAFGNPLQVLAQQENARSGCGPVVITC